MSNQKFKLFFLTFFCLTAVNMYGQDDSPWQFGTDLMSRYIWRGVDLGGNSPSFQPSLSYNFETKNGNHALKIGAWGAYTYSPTANQEADVFFTYTLKDMVSLTVTDYFFPGLNSGSKDKYFEYGKDSTGHVIEGSLSFNGTEKIPFTLLFAINVYGNDCYKVNDNGSQGDMFMSKYVEAGYKTNVKGVDLNIFAGAALDDPDEYKGEAGYYFNRSAGIINLGVKATKKIEVTEKFSLPVQCALITNPEAEKLYLVFGFTF